MISSKHEAITEELRTRIATGDYAAGFPSVRSLANDYGVSSRTIGKCFKTLAATQAIITGPGGTMVNQQRRARGKTNVVGVVSCNPGYLQQMPPLWQRLLELMRRDGYSPMVMNSPDEQLASNRKFWIDNPVDGYIFIFGSFNHNFVQQLRDDGIPFVVANRMPGRFGVNSVDWDHRRDFAAVVEKLVAAGYRRIAFFHYLYHGMDEHHRLIMDDFIAEKHEFQLRDPELDSFVPENPFDPAEYADFLVSLKEFPEVILKIGEHGYDLVEALEKHGKIAGRDYRLLLGQLDKSNSDAKIADSLWKRFRFIARQPYAKPRAIKIKRRMAYRFMDSNSRLM